MIKQIFIISILLACLAATISCDSDGGVLSELKTAEIIPGVGVAGIKLGEYAEVVENNIQSPYVVGSGNGSRHWRINSYTEEPYEGLELWFISMDKYGTGPLDYIDIQAPYSGKTIEGIGIGTELSRVVELWGTPDRKNEYTSYITHSYCFDNKKLWIGYEDSLIDKISLGPFLPYWLDSDCFEEPNVTTRNYMADDE